MNVYLKILGSNKYMVFNIMFLTKIYYVKMLFSDGTRYQVFFKWGSCEKVALVSTPLLFKRLSLVNHAFVCPFVC